MLKSIVYFQINTGEKVLIILEVEDYQAWKKVFHSATQIGKDAGEISYQVLKYEVVVIF